MWKKTLVCALLLASMAAATPSMADARTYTYVALFDGCAGCAIEHQTPAGPVVQGQFRFVATGDRFTLTVDDFGTRDGGTVMVVIRSGGEQLFEGCLPVRQRRVIEGTTEGASVFVWLPGPLYMEGNIWDCGGTVGRARIDQEPAVA